MQRPNRVFCEFKLRRDRPLSGNVKYHIFKHNTYRRGTYFVNQDRGRERGRDRFEVQADWWKKTGRKTFECVYINAGLSRNVGGYFDSVVYLEPSKDQLLPTEKLKPTIWDKRWESARLTRFSDSAISRSFLKYDNIYVENNWTIGQYLCWK